MNSIMFVIKGELERATPVINISQTAFDLGVRVVIACGSCGDALKGHLQEHGIDIIEMIDYRFRERSSRVSNKIFSWYNFRYNFTKLLKEWNGYLYIGSADTAIALTGVLKPKTYYLHLRELHDTQPLYLSLLKSLAKNAIKVIVPELNRAYICRKLLDLDNVPSVIPNKPYDHARKLRMPIDFLSPEVQKRIEGSKCLIYQGPLHSERDLTTLIRTISSSNDYSLLAMGRDYDLLSTYKKIMPELIYIPFVTPPMHLNVTSWAHVGIITYDNKSLNTVYCAPNKIWEFSGFGIPMLCSENLGLKYSVVNAGAAIMTNLDNSNDIEVALENIESNYEFMSKRSYEFYDSINLRKELLCVLNFE